MRLTALRRCWYKAKWHLGDKYDSVPAKPKFNIVNARTGKGYAGFNRWEQPVFTLHRNQWRSYGSEAWAQRDIDYLSIPDLRAERIQ